MMVIDINQSPRSARRMRPEGIRPGRNLDPERAAKGTGASFMNPARLSSKKGQFANANPPRNLNMMRRSETPHTIPSSAVPRPAWPRLALCRAFNLIGGDHNLDRGCIGLATGRRPAACGRSRLVHAACQSSCLNAPRPRQRRQQAMHPAVVRPAAISLRLPCCPAPCIGRGRP